MNRHKQIQISLAALCGVAWIAAAIRPFDRQAWILENILLIIFAAGFLLPHSRLQLSTASHFCVAAFVILHIVGAHYTYAQMPVGLWAKNYFDLPRNPYDRFAHGAFGFLLALPIRELLLRFTGTKRTWSSWLALTVILAVSGLFEIIESTVAEMVAPGKGVDWLGGQGDEWDAQNDMAAAMVGALLMLAVIAIREWKTRER